MKLSQLAYALPLVAASAAPATQQQDAPGPFLLLAARSTSDIHYAQWEASGRHFWLGGTPSTYCPEQQVGDACPLGKDTAFVGLSALDTMVPGGQRLYVEPSGAVGFTQAHSAAMPPGSQGTGFVYTPGPEHGVYTFTGLGATGFMACISPDNKYRQVFANVADAKVPTGNPDDCEGFVAMAANYTGPHPAAWQYT